MKAIVLTLLTLISAGNTCFAANACESHFGSLRPSRPLDDLVSKISKEKFEFHLSPHLEYGRTQRVFKGSYEIAVTRDGKRVGDIIIQRAALDGPVPIYYGHPRIDPSIRGEGVGAMLYTLASRFVFRIGGVIISSPAALQPAWLTWQRLEEAGWVRRVDKIIPEVPGTPHQYMFKQDLLRKGFFSELDAHLGNFDEIQRLKPVPEDPALRVEKVDVLDLD